MAGGEGGIRTHGRLAPTEVFKTSALSHSATSPKLQLSAAVASLWPRRYLKSTETIVPQAFLCAASPVFKTGALNRSATLPSPEFSDLAGGSAGGKWNCRSGRAQGTCGARRGAQRPRCRVATRPVAGLRERESQQARAQQHEAGCSQCEETVGYQVMITHVTPATLEARPNSLKLSESARLKEVVLAQGQALERKPSNAWARKIPALNRPKNAVTVSIIAKSFAPLRRTERHGAAHSQKDSVPGAKIRPE